MQPGQDFKAVQMGMEYIKTFPVNYSMWIEEVCVYPDALLLMGGSNRLLAFGLAQDESQC